MFWDARRWHELQGTKAAKATSDFESFTRAVHQFIFRGGGITYSLSIWYLSVILSRVVLEGRGLLYPHTLVPLFDLLHHCSQPTYFPIFGIHREGFDIKTL